MYIFKCFWNLENYVLEYVEYLYFTFVYGGATEIAELSFSVRFLCTWTREHTLYK